MPVDFLNATFTISRKVFAMITAFLMLFSLGFAPEVVAGEDLGAEQRFSVDKRLGGFQALVFHEGDNSWDVGGLSEAGILLHVGVDLNKDGRLDVILKEGWEDGWGIFVYLQDQHSHKLVLSFPQVVSEIKFGSAWEQVDVIDMAEDQPVQLILYGNNDLLSVQLPYSIFPYLFSLEDGHYRERPIFCLPVRAKTIELRIQSEIRRLLKSAEDWRQREAPAVARSVQQLSESLRSELDRINKPCR